MATLFEDFQRMISPKWLRDGMGDAWAAAFGATKDRTEQWIRDLILARFPDFATVDALRLIGSERRLEPPFGDDVYAVIPAWRAKLKSAMERWDHGGTHSGVLRELRSSLVGPIAGLGGGSVGAPAAQLYLYDSLDVLINEYYDDQDAFPNFLQFAQPALPPLTLQFSSPLRWNTFVVVVLIDKTHAWHGGIPVDASSQAEQARRIVQRWRAGHAECRKIIIQDVGSDETYDVLWGIGDGIGDGGGPVWGSFNWGQAGGTGATTVYWTPPSPQ